MVFLTFFERFVYVFLSYGAVRIFNVFYTCLLRFSYVFDGRSGPGAQSLKYGPNEHILKGLQEGKSELSER